MSADELAARLGLRVPVVAAPLGGGPTTPQLVAAVCEAGGSAFLPAGYRTVEQLRELVARTRSLTGRPFGVNVFVPGRPVTDLAVVEAYGAALAGDARALGVEPGVPHWDDDHYPAKLQALVDDPVPVVSFTFGCPSAEDVQRLHRAGSLVLVTVTSPAEGALALAAGADGLVAQGAEAGGHSGAFDDDPRVPPGSRSLGLLPLLAGLRAEVGLPMLAAGGLMTGRDVAAVRAAGAVAAQLGTAFLCCPEAGTSAPHRAALLDRTYPATAVTRAFTGRPARALVNAFLLAHHDEAPAGYPEVHHLTRPLRAAAAAQVDADRLHLWAGQGWPLVRALPAGELVETLARELAEAPGAGPTRP